MASEPYCDCQCYVEGKIEGYAAEWRLQIAVEAMQKVIKETHEIFTTKILTSALRKIQDAKED